LAAPSLSIVIPVRDEAPHLPRTLAALVESVERSRFEPELVLVDDGSTDASTDVAVAAIGERLPLRILRQAAEGRFIARCAGVAAANSDLVLLLDARARLYPEALRFLEGRLAPEEAVWNGHVTPEVQGNPFGAFGTVLVHVAWARYFDEPRRTSFGLDDFDHFPKGTTCFLAPKQLLVEAMEAFTPRIPDWRLVSDDTQLIRWIAARQRIQLSPEFGCDYQPRTSLRAFLKNGLYRGTTFFDGHGRRESRFYPVVVGFFPVSVALALLALRRPLSVPAVVAASGAAAGAIAARARRPRFETVSFALLTPVYAVAHGAGMWRGLALLLRQRLRDAMRP
jgi:glycosyltransferase involved in cell wall biosynthesis